MRDSIYTIPIKEVFEEKETCSFCRMHDILEDRCVEYITGAAMMEPDIRIETNKSGFCLKHFNMMLKKRNRLSVALMLESHLDHIYDSVLTKSGLSSAGKGKGHVCETVDSCYVCDTVDKYLSSMFENTLSLWEKDRDFRELFSGQKFICLPHAAEISALAASHISKRNLSDFRDVTLSLSRDYLASLKNDVTAFCRSFDYRNVDDKLDSPEVKLSVERSIAFLTSGKVGE